MGLGSGFPGRALVALAQAAVPLDHVGMARERERRRKKVTGRDGAAGSGVGGDGIGERSACSVYSLLGWCTL
jgi:hypothetical protein